MLVISLPLEFLAFLCGRDKEPVPERLQEFHQSKQNEKKGKNMQNLEKIIRMHLENLNENIRRQVLEYCMSFQQS